jgi:hypothetical protein
MAFLRELSVDLSLNIEEGVYAANHFKSDGRDHYGLIACGVSSSLLEIGEDKEWPPRVAPTAGLPDLAGFAIWRIEFPIAAERIGLENASHLPRCVCGCSPLRSRE